PWNVDPIDDVHHGRVRPVLCASHPVRGGPAAQPSRLPGAPSRALLGPVRKGRRGPGGRGDDANPARRLRGGKGKRRMRSLVVLILAVAGSLSLLLPAGAQTTKLKIATCARTITAGLGAPFAVATKMGWFKAEGIEIEIVPLPGSTDCVKTIATKDVLVALPSVEPLAILRPQGVKAKFFYTAYQTNTYGIAVPADSPIQKHSDLKGKTIGVTNMSSAGVIIARAQAAAAGLNPDTDITIVVAGEGAQPAVMLKNKQVDALSQFDTQYALTEIAGVKLRLLDTS